MENKEPSNQTDNLPENKLETSFEAWEEFRQTGLLVHINLILNIFGWEICLLHNVQSEVVAAYPKRTKLRGVPSGLLTKSYQKTTEYLKKNINQILKESEDSVTEKND